MKFRHVHLAVALALGAPVLSSGCTASQSEVDLGTLEMPLRVETESFVYRLLGAEITLIGTSTETYDAAPDESTLALTVAPGDYLLRLEPGWELERTGSDGIPTILTGAELLSDNPQGVTVVNDQTTEVLLSFDANGETVTFGDGELLVGLEVCQDGVCENSLTGSIAGCLEANPTQVGAGVIDSASPRANVTRNGVPYFIRADYNYSSLTYQGTSFELNHTYDAAAPQPAVYCGNFFDDGFTANCGLPAQRSNLTTLVSGWRVAPFTNGELWSQDLELAFGATPNGAVTKRLRIRLNPSTPIGTLVESGLSIAGHTWDLYDGASVASLVVTDSHIETFEADLLPIISAVEARSVSLGPTVLGVAGRLNGDLSDWTTNDFCVAAE